nr:immunoglobulin heavy chain junction region [Mus musculus]MBK4188100.1 immunoglobulin heavy chain junction region [Mus musculus]MBK4188101.1 immunoglobulin heavy chain junction region [Mus musculus]MBK4188102.1 immunoglobulin heavy chain junction region [Mus musculus]MBK4188103.1 immunoglobulin heavy chain junction region [Mus musculus]
CAISIYYDYDWFAYW